MLIGLSCQQLQTFKAFFHLTGTFFFLPLLHKKWSLECLLAQVPKVWPIPWLAASANSHGRTDGSNLKKNTKVIQVDQSDDYLLSSHAKCPKFDELHAQVLEGQVMKSLYVKNEDLFRYMLIIFLRNVNIKMFRYISKHTGLNLTDIVHLDYVYDTLLCESIHNKALPKWTERVFPADNPGAWPAQFKALRDLSFTVNKCQYKAVSCGMNVKLFEGGCLHRSHEAIERGTLPSAPDWPFY